MSILLASAPASWASGALAQELPRDGDGAATSDESAQADAQERPPDEIERPGYVPGYRRHSSLGLSPYTPRDTARPGGLSSSYGAPSPDDDWTFRWTGYMSAALQVSFDDDERPEDGDASQLVFHVPPNVMDDWQAFTGTRTQPGNWLGMNFVYGNPYVNANVSITTWNPSRPTSYYQIGSQNFVNNAFLTITPAPIGDARVSWTVGFFANSYGNLSRYGSGLYSNPILGSPFGVGETLTLEYDVSESVTAIVEHGIMGDRVGKAPDGVVASSATRAENPAFPAAFTHHAHAGIIVSGDAQFKLQAHYLRNWAQDDSDQERNNSQTRYFVESDVRDGRINVFGFDAAVDHATFGYLGVGFSLIDAKNAFPLRGFNTYAGEGVRLTDSWLGFPTVGTGTVVVGAMNYSVSLGRVANYPRPFPGDHADVQLDTSIHVTRTATDYPDFDGRWRYKGALALNYRFLPFMGASGRWDAVVPNSKDSEETFHVLMPTLYFRTDWNSRETISLIYARWFFGERSRRDGSLTKASRLDDSMFALNFTMWW